MQDIRKVMAMIIKTMDLITSVLCWSKISMLHTQLSCLLTTSEDTCRRERWTSDLISTWAHGGTNDFLCVCLTKSYIIRFIAQKYQHWSKTTSTAKFSLHKLLLVEVVQGYYDQRAGETASLVFTVIIVCVAFYTNGNSPREVNLLPAICLIGPFCSIV